MLTPPRLLALLLALALGPLATAQPLAEDPPLDRVRFNEQDLWVSGANVAWVNFARDIGPGTTRLDLFEQMFRELRAAGGNSFRLWLHTNGATTPEFSGTGSDAVVVGPGVGAVEDLHAILDLAYEHDVSLMLCLWSFDMLQAQAPVARNLALLTDEEKLQAYLDHALVPMVEALRGHPAILAWEIFNEPEGMSGQFGWTPTRVNMTAIQRFVNRAAGTIKRADPEAQVTNGSWSFRASSDLPGYYNYYRDDRIVAQGGDEDGTLDFYTVHYYKHFGQGQSPFHRDASGWGLDKPVVIAEFYLSDPRGDGDPDGIFGVPWEDLYETLYDRGYAGAMGWQWFDWYANRTNLDGVNAALSWPRMLENMRAMYERHREDVELLYPGLRAAFAVDFDRIEAGQAVTLSWSVRGAEAVTLNDEPVAAADSLTLALAETTTFVLRAIDAEGEALVRELTVEVVDPQFVNRARGAPAVASSTEAEEDVQNPAADPQSVTDGNPSTRWSSAWRDGEWIYVDLGRAYDLTRVVLHWEAARAADYDLEVSFDARTWATVHEERAGSGAVDEVVLEDAPTARFVRMHGLRRATQWGFSLYELEVYGLVSERQPPVVVLSAPEDGQTVDAGSSLEIMADVSHDREIDRVVFYADGDSLGVAMAAPYTFMWEDVPLGSAVLTAIAWDADGLPGVSAPVVIEGVTPVERTRYEDTEAVISGNVSRQPDPTASGGTRLSMQGAPALIRWPNVTVGEGGTYRLVVAYRLLDGNKNQYVNVNGARVADVQFAGPFEQWLTTELDVELAPGANTIEIEHHWGWMFFDYIEIVGDGQQVSSEDGGPGPAPLALGANYPNPFPTATVIPYVLERGGEVRLEVFDVTGRRVRVLVDGVLPAGPHAVRFDTEGLASGVYVYRLQAEGQVLSRRMVVLR